MATKVRATRLVDGKNDDKGEDDDAKGHDGGARDDVDVDFVRVAHVCHKYR